MEFCKVEVKFQVIRVGDSHWCTFIDVNSLLEIGKKWKDRRRALEPAFRLQMIEKSIDVFNRVGDTVIDQLLQNSPNKSVELFHIMKRYTLDVLCESAMGISMGALKCPDSEYVKAIQRYAKTIQNSACHSWN